MKQIIKDLYQKTNANHQSRVEPKTLQQLGFSPQEIEEILTEFLTTHPEQVYKYGECPTCGSSVDCSYQGFDKQLFRCDCPIASFRGHEADATGWVITLI